MNQKIIDPCDTDTLDPDRRLMTWEKWVRIRNAQTVELGLLTDRPPADLAMNLLERVRTDKERKTVLENAKLSPKATTCRGCLWEDPVKLHQQCFCQPTYEVTIKVTDKGRAPVIEHIGVPKFIQSVEKGLSGLPSRKPCKGLEADYERYRDKREAELKDKIEKIVPHEPCLAELMIKGVNPIIGSEDPTIKPLEIPDIIITEPPDPHEDVLSGFYALRINNTVIIKEIPDQTVPEHIVQLLDEPWHEVCTSWTYYYNVPVNKMGRAKLYLMNLGTVTIRYCWKKLRKTIPFIPDDIYAQYYFFNKNEDLLSPGQSKEINITFLSTEPGIFNEYYEFSTVDINFFDTVTDKLTVNLHGEAVEQATSITDNIAAAKNKICERALRNIARSFINYMIDVAVSQEPEVIPYNRMFLERDLFVAKNPVLFYHQSEVEKMKQTYTAITDGGEWDLTIASWRSAMMKLDVENRALYYAELQKSFRQLLKPWHEGHPVEYYKERAVKIVLQRLADKFDKEYEVATQPFLPKEQPDVRPKRLTVGPSFVFQPLDEEVQDIIRNVFYIRIRERVRESLGQIAAVVSSIDMYRWIDINFCKQ